MDNSLPYIGGVVGLATYTGLDAYMKSDNKVNGLSVGGSKKSMKSFATVKIDNTDMCDLDMRIIDHQGVPTHMGRVEFRLDGVWGTLCVKGMA